MTMKKTTFFYHFILPKAQEEEDHPALQCDVVEIRYDIVAKPLPLFPWEITKVLTQGDVVGFMAALELSSTVVRNRLLSHWDEEEAGKLARAGDNVPIMVRDVDTGSSHQMFLWKLGDGGGCYVVQGRWKKDFVDRRGLQEGMLIGLYWDVRARSLCFSLLH